MSGIGIVFFFSFVSCVELNHISEIFESRTQLNRSFQSLKIRFESIPNLAEAGVV